MIIYLFDQQKTALSDFLNQSDIELRQKSQDSGNIETWDQMGMNPLERIDAMILEITETNSQINYLLAQAILLHKNTLCLYRKNNPPRQLLLYLKKKNVPRCLQVKAYSEAALKDLFLKFVKNIKPHIQIAETPHIKYTLRMTENIEKYLNWKSKQAKLNKADFIRDEINRMAEADEEYNKWLKILNDSFDRNFIFDKMFLKIEASLF
ncbi:MAG: hypothetical protein V1898_04910 [Patescibacteria group bacterium]